MYIYNIFVQYYIIFRFFICLVNDLLKVKLFFYKYRFIFIFFILLLFLIHIFKICSVMLRGSRIKCRPHTCKACAKTILLYVQLIIFSLLILNDSPFVNKQSFIITCLVRYFHKNLLSVKNIVSEIKRYF